MTYTLDVFLKENEKDLFLFLSFVLGFEKYLMVKGDLLWLLEEFEKNEDGEFDRLNEIVSKTLEGVRVGGKIFIEFRVKIASSDFFAFNIEEHQIIRLTAIEYLKIKEIFVKPESLDDLLTINFKTFYSKFPSVREPKSIGHGVEYLNRYLSSNMFTDPNKLRESLFNFLFLHRYNGQQLILNDRIKSTEQLSSSIDKALVWLRKIDESIPYRELKLQLQNIGFEPGLGSNAGRIVESLEILDTLLQSPDHDSLKTFLSRIPMLFNITVISPHGFFGQEGVLGLPDTGGQVVYILDQVKALESAITESLSNAGLEAKPKIIILTRLIPNAGNTQCNQRFEKVLDTKNVWILRVPFRQHNSNVTDNWISRFEIYPYLEEFADDSGKELLAEFGRRPDLIIGNYTDGNLVATLLAQKFGVTQCIIAHALEKSKYLYGALYWESMEEQYHFSAQFTADLIAMNTANFIITSSYQEIAGTDESIGQYESYVNFTMPGLYRVSGGINLFHPKFNILPPGVNKEVYFPFTENAKRLKENTDDLERMIYGEEYDEEIFGFLERPEKMPIFSLARLDKIKNITSLAEWYGKSKELQEEANLIIVAGKVNPANSSDAEEREQIEIMHSLIEKYNLKNKIRWIGKLLPKDKTGEIYRIVADRGGIFVQPALFEGFGLTVLEAMRSGVPVFATQYGGPLEIIEEAKSGFHINPVNEGESVQKILDFITKCKIDKSYWKQISERGILRVDSAYNWDLYAKNLLSLAKIYGYWKFTSNIEMEELNSYVDVLYHLLYKPMANRILETHSNK